MFDAVIFDFDGVILDSEPLHYQACCHVFKPLGIELTWPEFLENYIGTADKEMFPLIFNNKNLIFSKDEIKNFIHLKVKYYTDMINAHSKLPMVSNVDCYIKSIVKADKKVAICSGSTRSEINAVLAKLNHGELQDYFKLIISSEDVREGKPSPEGYLLTAERLKLSPNKCLVIEDAPHGIAAAKAAGMKVFALPTTQHKSKLSQADRVLESFAELL